MEIREGVLTQPCSSHFQKILGPKIPEPVSFPNSGRWLSPSTPGSLAPCPARLELGLGGYRQEARGCGVP